MGLRIKKSLLTHEEDDEEASCLALVAAFTVLVSESNKLLTAVGQVNARFLALTKETPLLTRPWMECRS